MFPTIYREMAVRNRMTCKQLAKIVGITPKTMSAKLLGTSAFTLPEMRAIQAYFGGISLDELFLQSAPSRSDGPATGHEGG